MKSILRRVRTGAVVVGIDETWPPPWEQRLAERNLAAMWEDYRALGYQRLISTGTAGVLRAQIDTLTTAVGDLPTVFGVLLTCAHDSVRKRFGEREIGSAPQQHLASSIDNAG